ITQYHPTATTQSCDEQFYLTFA
ncbi:unnamed protein product, partial [Rotaria sordida]